MRRFVVLAVAALVLLAFAAPMTARTTTVKVFADQGWTNSFIEVVAGKTYSIQVEGRINTQGPSGPTVGPKAGRAS